MHYDVRSALGGLIAENVSIETTFAIIKGYEAFKPNMVRELKLNEHKPVEQPASDIDMTRKAQTALMSVYEATEE